MQHQPPSLRSAIDDIATIRQQLTAGRMFSGFGPAVVAITALAATITTTLQLLLSAKYAATDWQFIGVWLVVAVFSIMLIGLEVLARQQRTQNVNNTAMLRQVFLAFLPAGLVGGMITMIVFLNAATVAWILPGIWQLLLAMAAFSSTRFLPRTTTVVAAWYMVAGSSTLYFTSIDQSLTTKLAPLMMGIPFTIGQGLMAWILYTTQQPAIKTTDNA